MLQLARRETLGVHVGEFLQLQRPFEGDRVADVAADEQDRLGRRDFARQLAHRLGHGECGGDLVGNRAQCVELAGDLVAVLRAASLREREPDELDRGDLRDERLGGSDTDLRTGMRVEHRVGLARDLCAVGVADGEHLRALLPRVTHRFERVGRLAGLADRDDERLLVEHRVAVAELRGQFDLDRDAGPVLDGLLADESRVEGRTRGDDEHLVDVAQFLPVQALLVERDLPVDEVPEQGVPDGTGLFLDLLEHEVVEAALLGGGEIPVDVERPSVDGGAVEVGDRVAVAADLDDLVLAELDGVAGEFDERRDVAAEERLAVADAEHERRVSPRGNDDVGLVGVEQNQRECAF